MMASDQGAGHPRPDGKPPRRQPGCGDLRAGRPGFRGLLAGQGSPQALLADMPEVMLDAVDHGYRDLVPVLPQMAVGCGDVELFPGHTELGRDPRDDFARVVAQVTPRPAEQRDDMRLGGHRAPLLRGRAGWPSRGPGWSWGPGRPRGAVTPGGTGGPGRPRGAGSPGGPGRPRERPSPGGPGRLRVRGSPGGTGGRDRPGGTGSPGGPARPCGPGRPRGGVPPGWACGPGPPRQAGGPGRLGPAGGPARPPAGPPSGESFACRTPSSITFVART
jgi:hypothetical protein